MSDLSVYDAEQKEITVDIAFSKWREMTIEVRETGRCVFFIGNGASASMSSHFAADLCKNGGVNTEVFTDLSLITAVANDICYENVFSEPLSWKMQSGDMLISISSSGNSPNILNGTRKALEIGGKIITISAMESTNALREMGELNFYIPAMTYGLAETGHAAILHYWMDMMEKDHARTI